MSHYRTLSRLAATALTITLAACGDSTEPPPDDHDPATYQLLIDGVAASAPYTFTQGRTARVRIRFTNAGGEDLDGIESSHFGLLTFDPADLATVQAVPDHHFQFDVTGGITGAGAVTVSYGHDQQADEHVFEPAAVTVAPAAQAQRSERHP
jgi:hypothetical protein